MATDRKYGLLLIDKDAGPTSFNAIAGLRRLLGMKKIGHAGTLDPFATGLLTVAFGKATAALHHLQGLDKSYDVQIRLGVGTDSGDSEGEIISRTPVSLDVLGPGNSSLHKALTALTGDMMQVPPMHAAVKVDGKRLYEYAREGLTVQRKARPIHVHDITCTDIRASEPFVDIDLRMHVSSGTYVRQLAVSLGTLLGVPAHAQALRRTSVGPFSVRDAHRLEPWFDRFNACGRDSDQFFDQLAEEHVILPVRAAYFDLPVLQLSESETSRALHGQRLLIECARVPSGVETGTEVFLDYNGTDVAVARCTDAGEWHEFAMKKVWGTL